MKYRAFTATSALLACALSGCGWAADHANKRVEEHWAQAGSLEAQGLYMPVQFPEGLPVRTQGVYRRVFSSGSSIGQPIESCMLAQSVRDIMKIYIASDSPDCTAATFKQPTATIWVAHWSCKSGKRTTTLTATLSGKLDGVYTLDVKRAYNPAQNGQSISVHHERAERRRDCRPGEA